jgi:hypothetical protein
MTQLEKTVTVMNILGKRFPKLKSRDIVDLASTIVEHLSEPKTKLTEKKSVFDTGSRSGT